MLAPGMSLARPPKTWKRAAARGPLFFQAILGELADWTSWRCTVSSSSHLVRFVQNCHLLHLRSYNRYIRAYLRTCKHTYVYIYIYTQILSDDIRNECK